MSMPPDYRLYLCKCCLTEYSVSREALYFGRNSCPVCGSKDSEQIDELRGQTDEPNS